MKHRKPVTPIFIIFTMVAFSLALFSLYFYNWDYWPLSEMPPLIFLTSLSWAPRYLLVSSFSIVFASFFSSRFSAHQVLTLWLSLSHSFGELTQSWLYPENYYMLKTRKCLPISLIYVYHWFSISVCELLCLWKIKCAHGLCFSGLCLTKQKISGNFLRGLDFKKFPPNGKFAY